MCGNTLTPAITSSAAVACEGNRVWTFTYTDCASNVVAWTSTYTVDIPTFTIPYANGASTVSCVSGAQVDPGDPGVVTDMCGNTLTPVVTAPSPSGCTGVGAVWTYTYTDCAGNTADWTHTYTINLAPFSIATAPGASTVNCSANAAVQPAGPGVVNDACGNVIIPVITSSAAVACEGNRVWTFTYTDCAGNTAAWTYTYTVDMPIFAIGTLNGASTVQCIAQAIAPAPPAVNDVCGNAITPVMTQNANPACEGVKIYTFTYTDCAANVVAWTYTYTVDIPVLAIGTPNGASTVQCIAQVVAPVPPAVNDVCGNAIIPVMTENADPVCVGDKVYTFTYTDCAGSASIWTYTFSINDNVLPTASNPAPISVPLSLLSVLFPDPLVVIDEADNCTANPTVVWVSDVSDGNVCNLEEVTRTYSVTDDCGNQIFVTQIITILAVPAPIDAGPDATICAGEFITLEAVNPWGVPISWSPNNPPVDGVPFQPGSTQTYTVTAENLGCISTDSVTITLQELQLVSFIGDILSGCEPLTVTFTNTSTAPSGLVNCVWNINGQSLSGCGSVAYTFDNAGLYDVTLTTTSATGCVNSITYIDYIDVEAIPTASFNVSTTEVWDIDAQVDFTNTSVGASDYLWNFGNNSGSSILDNPSHTFLDLGVDSYQVELIAYSPLGCTDTAYRTISVLEELIYYVPNTFTPDGDNYNEYFKPIFTSGYDPYDFDLFIFNRWGEIIWESHDATVGWDGTYGGSVVQDGTYIWKIEFKSSETDKRIMKTGHVNIIK
ncbi:MAG: gliding motility-associated C-terminal domain-containing protein, partial [Crocinitomicaceae bacterium]